MRTPASRLAALAAALLLAACAEQSDLPAPSASVPQTASPEGGTAPVTAAPEGPLLPDTNLPSPSIAELPVPGSNPGSRSLRTAPPVERSPEQVPDYYMAIQHSGGQPVSIIFAIDDERDGNPTDDPAIRITPDAGKCNPAEMRSYDFPARYREKPVYGFSDLRAGVSLRDLPAVMAIAVSEEMLALGLAAEPQDTQPQNVCTRKLWERVILVENAQRQAQAAGQ